MFLIFMFLHLIPGDPARFMVDLEVTSDDINILRDALGLNDPLPIQFINYVKDLFHGDLGDSYKSGLPVAEMIGRRLGVTLMLSGAAIGWAVLFGILIGVLSAIKRGKIADYICMIVATSGISIPGFWFGLVLINVFAVKLRLLPSGGIAGPVSFILPSLALGIGIMGTLARYSRSSMLETMQEDYVRTARAKGQREWVVIIRHVLRNSLVQVVTVVGLQIGGLLSGAVIAETVFSIPGMGRLLVDSINFRDYKVVQALLLFFAIEYITINLLVDLLYGVLNPKIKYSKKSDG
jgi:glutathione transport system permease protein